MRIVLADLKGGEGCVSTDTVGVESQSAEMMKMERSLS
jgi:hypothetical protein